MSDPGGVRCWVTCNPCQSEQTKIVPENDKLSPCIAACTGSFEKAKCAAETGLDVSKRQDDSGFATPSTLSKENFANSSAIALRAT
ncbi:hypothetical protein F5Y12DRAFT_720868 [Xylaria sp. FL1777]|nr:hypothetical protein F5Y12DRAFT_720868 [Xylaria sp. FL1777]